MNQPKETLMGFMAGDDGVLYLAQISETGDVTVVAPVCSATVEDVSTVIASLEHAREHLKKREETRVVH